LIELIPAAAGDGNENSKRFQQINDPTVHFRNPALGSLSAW